VVRALLEACGPVTSWKRMQDSDGRPKGFGFCEFKARFVLHSTPRRVLRVMHDRPLMRSQGSSMEFQHASSGQLPHLPLFITNCSTTTQVAFA